MLDAFARAVTRRAIIKYARTVYRRLESTSRDLVPSVSQPLENIQHSSVIVRNSLIVLQEQSRYPVHSFLEARVVASQVLMYSYNVTA